MEDDWMRKVSSIGKQWSRKVKQESSEHGTSLVALHSPEEWVSLQRILGGAGWKLCEAATFVDARAALLHSSFDVVICAARFGDGHSWKDMLAEVRSRPVPPALIVADRLADSALWAEVLNLGSYDLLITPFEAAEVLRVVPMACEFRRRQTESHRGVSKAA
jgi:DNA-binding NtrC family response regulator